MKDVFRAFCVLGFLLGCLVYHTYRLKIDMQELEVRMAKSDELLKGIEANAQASMMISAMAFCKVSPEHEACKKEEKK